MKYYASEKDDIERRNNRGARVSIADNNRNYQDDQSVLRLGVGADWPAKVGSTDINRFSTANINPSQSRNEQTVNLTQ